MLYDRKVSLVCGHKGDCLYQFFAYLPQTTLKMAIFDGRAVFGGGWWGCKEAISVMLAGRFEDDGAVEMC